jgi:hypothetical protein
MSIQEIQQFPLSMLVFGLKSRRLKEGVAERDPLLYNQNS